MKETEQNEGDISTSLETNPYDWQRSHTLLEMVQDGGVFTLIDSLHRNLIPEDKPEYPNQFHGLAFVFDENGMVAGLTGRLGAMTHLLVPSTDNDDKPILNVSKGYHHIIKEKGKYYGRLGASPKEEIVITVQKPH